LTPNLGSRGNQRHQRRLIDIAEIRMPAAGEKIELVALSVVATGGGRMHDIDQDGNHPDDRLAQKCGLHGIDGAGLSRANHRAGAGSVKPQGVKLVAALLHCLRQRRRCTASLGSLLKHTARRILANGEMPYPNWSRP
jgi:hypothetical protein